MKKRILVFLLCISFLVLCRPLPVGADMGPKPSVQITFENMGDEVCYGTLLSKSASTGPASAWDGNPEHIRNYHYDYEIWEAFANYPDADGYYFLQEVWCCSETKQLNWTYYPPSPFKILLYYPESGSFVVSGIYERYAFDSYYTVNIGGEEIGSVERTERLTAKRSYDYAWEIFSLICRIVITVGLEFGIALLFVFREKKQLLLVAGVNLVTQVLLNVALNVINYYWGSRAFVLYYLLLEIVVFVVEAAVYRKLLHRVSKEEIPAWKPGVYAFTANLFSFTGGLLIARWIPGIF